MGVPGQGSAPDAVSSWTPGLYAESTRCAPRLAYVPDKVELLREQPDRVVRDVDLPPRGPLLGRRRIMVVVVVPPLSEDEDAEHDVVPRRVIRRKPPRSPEVPRRIDEQRSVESKRRCDPEAPDHARPAQRQGAYGARHERRQPLEAIEETQLGEARELSDVGEIVPIILAAEDPTQVRMPEAAERWRVRITRAIRVAMMATVMTGPPQRAILHRCATRARPRRRNQRTRLVLNGVVRKVSVIPRGHALSLEQIAGASETDEVPRARHEQASKQRPWTPKTTPVEPTLTQMARTEGEKHRIPAFQPLQPPSGARPTPHHPRMGSA